MKKQYLLLFTFFLIIYTQYTYSQTYRVDYTWEDIISEGGGAESLIVTNGSQTATLATGCNNLGNCPDLSGVRNISFLPTQFFLQASGTPTGTTSIIYSSSSPLCDTGSYTPTSQNGVPNPVTLQIRPNVSISSSPSMGVLGICEDIQLSASNGFPSSAYNWEYNFNGSGGTGGGPIGPGGSSGWQEIPGTAGQRSITVSSSDIPDVPVETAFMIRVRFCPGQTTNVRTFNYTNCSPTIENVIPSNTSCVYREDGNVRFFFSRALDNGEVLNGVTIFQNSLPPGASFPLGSNITALETDNSFLWPLNNLPVGEYFLRYQSDLSGTDESSPVFTINSPSPFTFSVSANEILCNDGSTDINISASGGTQPYFYSINNGSLIEFSGTSTTSINDVISANYELRVFDNNGCTELD